MYRCGHDIVILSGLPGVGKLTVAGLSPLRGYRVFHNHLVFDAVEALLPFGSAAFLELRERLWLDLPRQAMQERVGISSLRSLAIER
jgi:hypothetical protein